MRGATGDVSAKSSFVVVVSLLAGFATKDKELGGTAHGVRETDIISPDVQNTSVKGLDYQGKGFR
jgi:hypothetical protein